jgi:serine/threonine protein kinase/uncharacterized protein HemY
VVSQVISHYRLIKKLGGGGMGEVYLAEDTGLGRMVAIKVLPSRSVGDEVARRRLVREARSAANLDHPNICPVYEVGSEGDTAFIAMQYVEGETVAARIAHTPPSLEEAVDIAAQVADALAEAHSHGVVHRDIKPQNMIVTHAGRVKVLDFGLAKMIAGPAPENTMAETVSLLTDVGVAVGTVPYMSPEQARGQSVDGRSDLFSLGVVLYQFVTGRLPFSGSSAVEVCGQIIHVDPVLPSDLNPMVSSALQNILLKALAKAPEARYQSASEMLADLRRVGADSESSSSVTRSLLSRPAPLISGLLDARRAAKAVASLAAISTAALIAVWLAPRFLRSGAHQPSAEARRFYELGTDGLRNGSYYQASKALERSVALDNKYAFAHARLAEAYAEIDQSEKAKDELLIAASLVPNRSALAKSDAMYLDAIMATVRREFSSAIDLYRKIADQAPDAEKARLYLDLGRAYDKNDNTDKAIESYLDVSRLDPQSPAAFLQLGILYGRKQNVQTANQEFDKALAVYQDMSNQEGVTEVLYQRGLLLNKMNRVAEARKELETALEKARTADSKYQQIKILLQLSRVSYLGGDSALAIERANEAIASARGNNVRSLATDGLIDLGNTYNLRGEVQEAEKVFKQALELASGDKAHRSEARAMLALGGLNVTQDNPDRAISYLEQALGFYQPAGFRKETSLALILLGRAKRQQGDYEAALQTYNQQLDLARELGDLSQSALSQSAISNLLGFDLERYAEALGHLDESLKINMSLGAKFGIGNDLMNKGRLLWPMGRYEEAKEALDQAFTIASDPGSGSKQGLAWIYLCNAQMALSKRNLSEAGAQARKALTVADKQFKEISIQASYTLGMVEGLSGHAQEGTRFCKEAISLAGDRTNPRLLSQAILALAEVMLVLRHASGALNNALQAQERFARWGQQESQWRAWLAAARAAEQTGDDRAVRDYTTRAVDLLSGLQHKWDAETYKSYIARPDIVAAREQLDRLRGPHSRT